MDETPDHADVTRKRWRRRPRWSVRFLFLVLTAIAICLGVLANRAERQRQAVADLRTLEAMAFYDCTTLVPRPAGFSEWREVPSYPSWLVGSLGLDYFHSVMYVTIHADHKLECLPFLKKLPSLQGVKISWNTIQDDAVLEAYRRELPGVSLQVVLAVVG